MKKKILIVEDERDISELLSVNLERLGGYDTEVSPTVAETMRRIESPKADYDLILLDMRLPDGDGYTVLQCAKTLGFAVIVLTAVDEEYKVAAYLSLADDYAPKDTRMLVLLKRIEKVLQRREERTSELEHGGIRVDLLRYIVYKNGVDLMITGKDYKVLLQLMQNIGMPMRSTILLRDVWDIDGDFVDPSTLRKSIQRLRQKIEDDPKNPTFIVTVPDGYMIAK